MTLDSAKILRLIRGDSHSSQSKIGSGSANQDSDMPFSGYRSNQNSQRSRESNDSFKRPNAKTNRVSATVSNFVCLDLVVPSKSSVASDLHEDRDDNPALVNKVQQRDFCLKDDAHVTESVPVSVEIQFGSDRYEFSALVDDGADLSLISENHLSSVDILHEAMRAPSAMKITLADGRTSSNIRFGFYCDIVLHTNAGPLLVRKQCLFVVEGSLPQLILGRPFLKNIGIDVESQLCMLAARGQDLPTNNSSPDLSSELIYDIDYLFGYYFF